MLSIESITNDFKNSGVVFNTDADLQAAVAAKVAEIKPKIAAAIKAEIANDPAGVGYAGKSNPQKLALLMANGTKTITEQTAQQAPMSQIIRRVIDAGIVLGPENFTIDANGKPSVANVDLQAAIKAEVQKEIDTNPAYQGKTKDEVATALRTAQITTVTKTVPLPPRLNAALAGIPYAKNDFTVADLIEALK